MDRLVFNHIHPVVNPQLISAQHCFMNYRSTTTQLIILSHQSALICRPLCAPGFFLKAKWHRTKESTPRDEVASQ